MDKTEKSIILLVLIVIISCLCLSMLAIGVALAVRHWGNPAAPIQASATDLPMVPTITVATPTMTALPELTVDDKTLSALMSAEIPEADNIILAQKFLGKGEIPDQLTSAPMAYEVGDELDFYMLNTDTHENVRITTTLRYASDKVYFWVENGVETDPAELKQMMATFESQIYPTDQEFFGKEWIPGVDNDPHLYIVYASNLGERVAGYTAGNNAYLPAASQYSNAHEMFGINADVQTLTDPYTLSVMAHELQHLIHGYHDSNEELWLNEGFSELATLLNGFEAGGFDYVFTNDTDLQLNDWSTDPDENSAHYGASFLYVTYLLDRFGEETTRQIVADAENGFESIDRAFSANHLTDPQTGQPVIADEFFRDWTIANYLVDNSLYDGRYTYTNYSGVYAANTTDTETICDGAVKNRSVHQYGTDYIELDCPIDNVTFEFTDAEAVQMLPIDNYPGSFTWSNRADASDTSMLREFDFTALSGPIQMTYQAWYDLEEDYDFVYLLATTDGQHWQMLDMPSCTSRNLNGNNYGCGYNGSSGGWITESVDLSRFAGQKVTLSFEYITDEAVAGEGFVLDNIEVPAIEYASDFEQDNGGWELRGFVNITNAIPQTYLVSVFSTNGSAPMQKFIVKDGQGLTLELDALPNGERYVIAISGAARYTRQEAQYQYSVR